MRNIILFIVALVFSMGIWAQAPGSRRQPQAGPAGGREPFEMKQSIYFEDGTLDEYTEFKWDPGFNFVENEARFSASGAMLEQVEYAHDPDKNNNMTTKITRDVESRLKNRVVYQYNAQGQLWKESLVDNKGKVVSSYEYTYDGRGNRVSRIIKNRAGDKLAETVYTFDGQGRMLMSETRDFSESAISSTRFSYDGQGNLISQEVLNADGRVTTNIRATWQNGREVRNEQAAADGTVQLLVTNEYGQDGELTKKTIDNVQGESKQVVQYEYTFRPPRR